MTVKIIREIAKEKGVAPGKLKKEELIRAIQTDEGNRACFGYEAASCGQDDCLWREDCLKIG